MKHLFSRASLAMLLATAAVALFTSLAHAQDAAAIYKAKCVACHGADGRGSAMGQKLGTHDFASPEVQNQTDVQLIEIMAKGKGKMPGYGGKLKDTEIKDLVAYVRSLGKK